VYDRLWSFEKIQNPDRTFELMRMLVLAMGLLLVSFADARETPAPNVTGFTEVKPGKQFSFPADHQLHPDFQTEWWYVTANLRDKQGNDYGVQFTLFAVADFAGGNKHRVYFAHATVASEQAFFFAERYAREDMATAGVQAQPWAAYIDHWRFEGTDRSPFPGTISVEEKQFGYELFTSDSPYFLQGDQGFSKKNASGSMASYYYSAPFVSVKGSIRLGSKTHAVEGQAWLDREWSTSVIRTGTLGWDWFALSLSDDSALMLYRVRSDSESEGYLYGSLMRKDGSMHILDNDDVTFQPLRKKSFNQQPYTLEWRIIIPTLEIDITTRPINDDQFLATRIPYWEGAVRVTGSHQALGYMELFGER